jgi:pyruvate/2-oxoacid:ferredoxin oxidoreductase alpha subunit/ferredoxin
MNEIIEKLAYKIGEGFQASSLSTTNNKVNAFHRAVTVHESSDLSFIIGLASTGLRSSALLNGEKLTTNYNQLLTASRQHVPLVVNTNALLANESRYSAINNYANINVVGHTGCFQLIASSPQQEIALTIIAHRVVELSLIPGIVIADYLSSKDKTEIPSDEMLIKYLGNPDDQIECPTPAQQMIFGKTRRRIPNWFSLDLPIMLGAKKDGETISFETAASQKYFYDHLPQLIEQAYKEFNNVFGTSPHLQNTDITPVTIKGSSSEYAVITPGGQLNELFHQILKENNDLPKVEILQVAQLNPFPFNKISELLKGKKAVTILENTSIEPAKSAFHYQVLDTLNNTGTKVYTGRYSAGLDIGSLSKAIRHMVSNQPKTNYYLGLEFTKPSSNYPRHETLLQEIGKQYPEIASESISDKSSASSGSSSDEPGGLPLAVRMYHDKGPNYTRLSRFYMNTAFFYEHNEHHELVADPFAAVPITPSSSAGFFSQTANREFLPVLDPKKCTGCGNCFVHCPHSAIPPIAIGIEQLIKSGADIASAKGVVFTKLTPMVKNLAAIAAKTISDTEVTHVGGFLPVAFKSLASQIKLEGEKLATAQHEFNAVLNEISELPVAITDQFFSTPNSINQGSGELFSLAVNPTACTGCSLCVQVCEDEALTMEPQETGNLSKITAGFKLWEQLPDTSADTINRLYNDNYYSSLAAMMLSRNYYMAMSGAGSSANDSPYKTLLHIITATAESVVQPKIINQLKHIDELIDLLSENVHQKLSKALPKENLDELSKSLKNAQGKKLSFGEIVKQITTNEQSKFINTVTLSRKTDLVDALKSLKWALSEGPTGVGRSRYGMLVAGSGSMKWAKKYPHNNFTAPAVIHWQGSAPEQALGLFYGQLRYLLDTIKLMQRAVLESKDKYDPQTHDLEISQLSWNNLTDDEKKLIPPILLVAERDDLNETGWSSLNKLLAEKYPVKVFLLNPITSPNRAPVVNLMQTTAGLFSSIALKNAFVYQGGMGNVNHLFNGLMDGLDKTYPALFNLYALKFEKHGITNINWLPYASLALNSRAFPSIYFDPQEKNSFLNGTINLNGNKSTKQDWVQEKVELAHNNETAEDIETINYKITWADWAYTQTAWKTEFTLVKPDSVLGDRKESNVLIPEYIQLEAKGRKGKLPVIMRSNQGKLKYYTVSEKVVRMTETILYNWRTWQELAGLLTEFPSKLKAEVTKELSKKYEQETAELKNNYEQQLKEKEEAQTEILRQQLKEKLVALSNMAKN